MKTEQEIKTEIAALEACKKYAPHHSAFGDDNHRMIDVQIRVLKQDMDENEVDDAFEDSDEHSNAWAAIEWRNGEAETSPSSEWDHWKPKQ